MSKGHLLFLTAYYIATFLTLARADDTPPAGIRTAAGHSDTFRASSDEGTLLKVASGNEEENRKLLFNDKLATFVPGFYGGFVGEDGRRYIKIQDLTKSFSKPRVMDVKMGCRTFVEEEVARAVNGTAEPKAHFYEKIMHEDPAALSDEERRNKAVTKARYMQWRDHATTTARLGFRIEGMVLDDGEPTNRAALRKVRDESEVAELIRSFIGESGAIKSQYLNRLRTLRRVMSKSRFFMHHEFIGSSLLFLHDSSKAGVWMIDLVQTYKLADDVEVSHSSEWRLGNHEDCYLTGLDNLIHIISDLS